MKGGFFLKKSDATEKKNKTENKIRG